MTKKFTSEQADIIEFEIDDDTFYAVGALPGGTVRDLARVARTDDDAGRIDGLIGMFDQVLLPDSAKLFAERLTSSEHPISFKMAVEVFEWLVEQYAGEERPTEGRSRSRRGRPQTGPSSTDSAPSEDSTPEPLVSTGH